MLAYPIETHELTSSCIKQIATLPVTYVFRTPRCNSLRPCPPPRRRSEYSAYSAETARDSNGQTFHFSSLPVDSADDELLDEARFELRSRASGAALSSLAAPPPASATGSERTQFVTHDVTDRDTLQTIALQYSVPVSGWGRGLGLWWRREVAV